MACMLYKNFAGCVILIGQRPRSEDMVGLINSDEMANSASFMFNKYLNAGE